MIEIKRTDNSFVIASVMSDKDLWEVSTFDGQSFGEFLESIPDKIWYLVTVDGCVMGLYQLHWRTNVCLEVHAHIMKEFRKQYAEESSYLFYKILMKDFPNLVKVVAYVPDMFKNVQKYLLKIGFVLEGINRKSVLKRGDVIDQLCYGITRQQMEDVA